MFITGVDLVPSHIIQNLFVALTVSGDKKEKKRARERESVTSGDHHQTTLLSLALLMGCSLTASSTQLDLTTNVPFQSVGRI